MVLTGKRGGVLMVLALCWNVTIMSAPGQGVEPSRGRGQLDLNSAHVWRGITFNDALVLQPSVTINLPAGLIADAWGNWDMSDDGGRLREGDYSELDYSLWYETLLPAARLGAGVTGYTYHRRDDLRDDTAEAFVRMVWDLDPVAVGAAVFYDFDELDGYYARTTAEYGTEVCSNLDLKLLGAVGYADGDWSTGSRGGWHDYLLSLTVAYIGFDLCDVAAAVSYTDTLHRDVLPEQDVDWFGGVHLSRSF